MRLPSADSLVISLGSSRPTFGEWLARKIGPKWVLARATLKNIQRHGPDTVFLSLRRWRDLQAEYERETGHAAHGLNREPSRAIAVAAAELVTQCRALIEAHDAGRNRTLTIESIRSTLAKIDQEQKK